MVDEINQGWNGVLVTWYLNILLQKKKNHGIDPLFLFPGMDPINERKMFQQLVRAASQPSTPQ